jgi:hypothetical protein
LKAARLDSAGGQTKEDPMSFLDSFANTLTDFIGDTVDAVTNFVEDTEDALVDFLASADTPTYGNYGGLIML